MTYPLITKYNQAICLNTSFNKLTETRDSEAWSDIITVLAVSLLLAFVNDAAALCRGNANNQVKVMLLSQFRPSVDNVPVILGWGSVTGPVIYTIMIEEHAKYFVSCFQGRLCKEKSGIG
jgi:hypothetical protein